MGFSVKVKISWSDVQQKFDQSHDLASFMSLKDLSFVTMKLGEVTKIKDNNNIKNIGKQWKDYFI